MSYAIIEAGGKQYRMEEGAELDIDRVKNEESQALKFDKVLLTSGEGDAKIGRPYLAGAFVEAEIVKHYRLRKIISYKYIRREGNAKTKIGHRQWVTRIKVKSINSG